VERTEEMPKFNNFIDGFQEDHRQLLELIISFRNAIESANRERAKEILNKIDSILSGHFSFEETYLYPRLRRLVSEITENLRNEQQMIREFVGKSRSLLDKNKLTKNETPPLLGMLTKLCKTLGDCNDLVFLAKKFNKEDKEDLNKRFKECLAQKSAVCV
jgi:iron-sulfur cluster repair protein YtfE (RIC family)